MRQNATNNNGCPKVGHLQIWTWKGSFSTPTQGHAMVDTHSGLLSLSSYYSPTGLKA